MTTPSLIAAISLAALEMAGFDPVSTAFAQTPAPVTLSGLFDPDLAEIRPDAIGKLKDAIKKAHRDCYPPRVKFTVVTKNEGDPLFVKTLGDARVAALQDKDTGLPSLGLEPGQFKVDSVIGVVDGVLVSYDKFKPEDDNDREAPKFKVTSIPKEGSKVKLGSQIEVTIKASERYEDGHKSWPTGVYNIQLIDDDGVVKSENYGKPTNPCATPTFKATYTVPCKATVHLTAIVEDGVGNKDSWVGEFPMVGGWHGTDENFYDITSNDGVADIRERYHGLVTFDLCETSKDKLEGQAQATWTSSQEVIAGKCAPSKTTQDPKVVKWDAQLTGNVQRHSGSTRFEFHATPDRGPAYKWIIPAAGECTTGDTLQRNDNRWEGATFDLKPGHYQYDRYDNAPLGANDTGQHYFKFHIELSGK